MSILRSNPIYDENDRGLPVRTPYTRYIVKCDVCGKQIEFLSDEGVYHRTLEPHGMDTWLRPEGMGHICKEHT